MPEAKARKHPPHCHACGHGSDVLASSSPTERSEVPKEPDRGSSHRRCGARPHRRMAPAPRLRGDRLRGKGGRPRDVVARRPQPHSSRTAASVGWPCCTADTCAIGAALPARLIAGAPCERKNRRRPRGDGGGAPFTCELERPLGVAWLRRRSAWRAVARGASPAPSRGSARCGLRSARGRPRSRGGCGSRNSRGARCAARARADGA